MTDSERLVSLVNHKSVMIFRPQDSRVLSLTLGGEKVLGEVTRGDDSIGSTHPCSPNFDNDTSGRGLPRHGTLRNSSSSVELSGYSTEGYPTRAIARAAIIASNYPKVDVTQIYTLGKKSLTIETSYFNSSDESAPINHGLHPYFLTACGWEGTTLNGIHLDRDIREDGIFRWQAVNLLVIPGQPRLLLTQEGLPYANPWTWNADGQKYDSHYFSLSAMQGNPRAGYFGSTESLVAPDSGSYTRLTISLAPIPPVRS